MFKKFNKIVLFFQFYFNNFAVSYFSFKQLIATSTASFIVKEEVSILIETLREFLSQFVDEKVIGENHIMLMAHNDD